MLQFKAKMSKIYATIYSETEGIDNLGEELTLNFLVQCNALYPGL